MTFLKRLVREAHRRSLWQVLAVYAAGSWVAIQVVGELTRSAGLPDWVPPAALVLLIVGLPIVLATAVVQEGAPGGGTDRVHRDSSKVESGEEPAAAPTVEATPRPSFLERHLTWKRAILGGLAAFTLLGMAVTGYFVMRAAGVGPVASLVAKGVIEEGEPIVLADFGNATNDARLSTVVTEALRIDLASSPALTVVPDQQIRAALERMEREVNVPLEGELAREVALREGVTAVLDGEIGAAGSGFILTATLRSAEDSRPLATFRRTARGTDDVIDAIDGLSQDIRERAGESLRAIRGSPPLSRVTTSSLDALQRFTEGERLFNMGDETGAIALLEQAVALDPAFAMAWRKLAVALGNLGIEEERMLEATERAYGLRERLTEKERYLAEALYHSRITEDPELERRAYENVLRLDPDDSTALNNLALLYMADRRYDRAEELYRRGIAARDQASGVNYQNLVGNQMVQGKLDGAREVLAAFQETSPDDPRLTLIGFWVHVFSGNFEAADRMAESLAQDRDLPASRRRTGMRNLAMSLVVQGRLAEAERQYGELFLLARSEFGPEAEYSDRANRMAVVSSVTGDPAVGLPLLEELSTSELARQLPPEDLAHFIYAVFHLEFQDAEGLRQVLDGWERVPEEALSASASFEMEFFRRWLDGGSGDPEGMLQALQRLEEAADCPDCYGAWRARFLEAAGRLDEALAAWQALRSRPIPNRVWALALIPSAHHETARLAEMVGDTVLALEAYEAFVDLWRNADPELQPRVQAARERMAALSGSP